jgi:hypothetical protein
MPSSYEKRPRMARPRNIFGVRSVNFHGDVAPVPKPLTRAGLRGRCSGVS